MSHCFWFNFPWTVVQIICLGWSWYYMRLQCHGSVMVWDVNAVVFWYTSHTKYFSECFKQKRYLVFLHKTKKKSQLINPTLVQQVVLSHYIGSSHNGTFYLTTSQLLNHFSSCMPSHSKLSIQLWNLVIHACMFHKYLTLTLFAMSAKLANDL